MSNPDVPACRDEWKSQVATAFPREGRPPIPSRINWHGGSNMSHVQFLSLRGIWPTLVSGSEFAREFETELRRELDTARNWLDLFPPFRAYLECVRNNQSTTFWSPEAPGTSETALSLGIMQLARSRQSGLFKAISDGVADEEMVISSLISFLDGITVLCPHVRCGWSARRQSITGDFGAQKLKVFVDGLLVARDGTPKVLLEAKRRCRQYCEPKVCLQETGEFVAFLKSTTTPISHDRHFFLLSQNQG
ncbi:hypothetical protein N7478_001163 [Penicillium angulare]|uniref:uncharacterized protein n=1 Tax=Penicillium angulare TaxID=116970 RepID=UPI0025415BDC|nr:uncharacterized protein N7478_001163 [Penicillium angulare]KAJ5291912.1 hypothetical protein N7478_001163 [Penicillium angulare]